MSDSSLGLCEDRRAKCGNKKQKFLFSRPKIVCLCGSMRFAKEFERANERETMAGHIVLSIGVNAKKYGIFLDKKSKIKISFTELHKRKIDLCDEILVLNKNGYIGKDTLSEIKYAKDKGKNIRYLEKPL